jgi:hypothetical protein
MPEMFKWSLDFCMNEAQDNALLESTYAKKYTACRIKQAV